MHFFPLLCVFLVFRFPPIPPPLPSLTPPLYLLFSLSRSRGGAKTRWHGGNQEPHKGSSHRQRARIRSLSVLQSQLLVVTSSFEQVYKKNHNISQHVLQPTPLSLCSYQAKKQGLPTIDSRVNLPPHVSIQARTPEDDSNAPKHVCEKKQTKTRKEN